ncbi:MAG: hypothetical protein IPG58_18570 [Acidobacteria bacterium]|nr:hypothetical protein [Acidobacteriota bacterium]
MEQKSVVSGQLSEEKTSEQVKLPASRKVYVETNGSTVNQNKHNLRIPFREIALSPSKEMDGSVVENAPVRVYDTSGVWTDPATKCDVREGYRHCVATGSSDAAMSRNMRAARSCRRTMAI